MDGTRDWRAGLSVRGRANGSVSGTAMLDAGGGHFSFRVLAAIPVLLLRLRHHRARVTVGVARDWEQGAARDCAGVRPFHGARFSDRCGDSSHSVAAGAPRAGVRETMVARAGLLSVEVCVGVARSVGSNGL